jgi:glutamine amidotransferase
MKKKVIIIDYNLGNLFSVKQACDSVGMDAKISSNKSEIEDADAIILPGVGAFIEAMQNLKKLDLIDPIKHAVNKGVPFFGVCLGLQLIFTRSEEFGSGEGLDLIPGVIKKFPATYEDKKIKVPQIAWNTISSAEQSWTGTPLFDVEENEFMYFVHSYYVEPADNHSVLTRTNYEGLDYCSGILKDNIFAVQFHPEKSAQKGISIYKNWATINNLI